MNFDFSCSVDFISPSVLFCVFTMVMGATLIYVRQHKERRAFLVSAVFKIKGTKAHVIDWFFNMVMCVTFVSVMLPPQDVKHALIASLTIMSFFPDIQSGKMKVSQLQGDDP